MSTPDTGAVAVPRPTERMMVDFTGEGAGHEELSWGMWEIWNAMCAQHSALPIGGRAPLAAGTGITDVADELRYLMNRFPSMRTRLRFDTTGHPTQELFDSGHIALEIYDAADTDPRHPDPQDAEKTAAAVEEAYRQREFDYAGQWPVRMAVVRWQGRPAHLVTIMHHLVSDAQGGSLMLREVQARETAPVTGMQQLEQARWQGSPAGQRQNERALRHWETVLRTIPARQLPGPTDPRTPRHWVAEFRSPALVAALPVIAARTGADLPEIRLALFAVALYRATGISPVVVRPIVNNRFRRGLSDVVCMVAQAGICVLDTEGATVDEVIEQTRRATMPTCKYAYFHPVRLRELVARIGRERGEDITMGSFFNDRSQHRPPHDDRARTVEELAHALRTARKETDFRWTLKEDNQTERFFINVDDEGDGLRFEIRIDTHYMSPAAAEALAHGMEAAAVEAALVPAEPALTLAEPALTADEAALAQDEAALAPAEAVLAPAEPVERAR
jgi:hypothetical protein